MPILTPNSRPISRRAAAAIEQARDAHRGDMDRVVQRAQHAGEERQRDLNSIQDQALRESVRQLGRVVR